MTTRLLSEAGFADRTDKNQEGGQMEEEFNLDDFLNEIESHNEKETYKKAVVISHKKYNMTTPAQLFYNDLITVSPGTYNSDTVNFVESDDKKSVIIYISVDSNADFKKFRGINSANLRFLRITEELIYKAAFVFCRPDGMAIREHNDQKSERLIQLAYSARGVRTEIFRGTHTKYLNINVSATTAAPVIAIINDNVQWRAAGNKRAVIADNNLSGELYPQTFWTNNKQWTHYSGGPVTFKKEYCAQHEVSVRKVAGAGCLHFGWREHFLIRQPKSYYDFWLNDKGKASMDKLVGRVDKNGKIFSAADGKAYTLTKWSDVKDFMKKKDA